MENNIQNNALSLRKGGGGGGGYTSSKVLYNAPYIAVTGVLCALLWGRICALIAALSVAFSSVVRATIALHLTTLNAVVGICRCGFIAQFFRRFHLPKAVIAVIFTVAFTLPQNALATHSGNDVSGGAIATFGVHAENIADGAIDGSAKIADGVILGRNLQVNTITADKLSLDVLSQLGGTPAPDSITTTELADGAVTSGKIGDAAVNSDKIGTNAVVSSKINALAVTADKLAADAVTSDKIGANQVGDSEIAADAVRASEIMDGEVGNAEIGTGAVQSDEIMDGGIMAADIGDDQVTADKVAANVRSQLGTGSSVDTSELEDDAVTTDKVADGAITAEKLDAGIELGVADNAVTGAKIADGAIEVVGSARQPLGVARAAQNPNAHQVQIAPGTIGLDDFGDEVNQVFRRIEGDIDRLDEGIAMSHAIGMMKVPDGKDFGVSFAGGFYQDKQAAAIGLSFRPTDGLLLSAGASYGFDSEEVGGGVSVNFGF